jgi:alanyl-tRNA synthetase
VKSTGEIGMLRILSAEKYKGMTRVSFIAGRRVLRDSRALRKNADTISRALKVPVAETGKGVLALLEKERQTEQKMRSLLEGAAETEAKRLVAENKLEGEAGEGKRLVMLFPNDDMEGIQRIAKAAQKLSPAGFIFASAKDCGFAALSSSKKVDFRPLLKPLLEANQGKGGGGPAHFQGRFPSTETLEAFLKALDAKN